MGARCSATASVNEVVRLSRADAQFVMSGGPRSSNDVNYLFPLAKRELSAFFHVVDQLFGAEQARQAALDWIDEMGAMSWPAGEGIPDWREATIRATARLCSSRSINLRNRSTKSIAGENTV